MTACPYGARFFNWKDPEVSVPEGHVAILTKHSSQEGTVGKCVLLTS
jgi:Fe-S-cluster-containing dehydrogenase component